jgi:hypothetical protein
MPITLEELNRDVVVVDERATVRQVRERVAAAQNHAVYIVVRLANGRYTVLRLAEIVQWLQRQGAQPTPELFDTALADLGDLLPPRAADAVEQRDTSTQQARERLSRMPVRRLVVASEGRVLGVLAMEMRSAVRGADPGWLDQVVPPAAAAPPSAAEPTRGAASDVGRRQPDVERREGWTESAPPSEAEPEPQPVLLGASAPRAARPGDEFTARFVAYAPEMEAEVQRLLERLSPRSESHLGVQRCRWAAGTRVTVKLSGTHLHVDPPEDEFVWEGDRSLVEFDVEVDRDAAEGVTTLRYDVFVGTFRVARLRVELEIRAAERDTRQTTVAGVEPVRTVFASYASRDRDRVLDMVSAIVNRVGLDVFLDCMDLNPSEQWKQRLESEIRARDQFLLFWSEHARASPWVDWEWRTALAQKGKESLDVQPLQPPQLAPPPDELSDLHFNDRYMLVRTAFEAMRGAG